MAAAMTHVSFTEKICKREGGPLGRFCQQFPGLPIDRSAGRFPTTHMPMLSMPAAKTLATTKHEGIAVHRAYAR